jgi:hypothetical protein
MNNDGKDLLAFAIEAHGGLKQWNKFGRVVTHLHMFGSTWKDQGQEGATNDIIADIGIGRQHITYQHIFEPDTNAVFTTDYVAVKDAAGNVIDELYDPLLSFEGHYGKPWSRPQTLYFSGSGIWTYFATPFVLAADGVTYAEIEPWKENGETWRRLEVIFPDHLAKQSKRQIFYFDANDGLLRRNDYWTITLNGRGAAHYVHDIQEFNGIKFPTKRRIYTLQADNTPLLDPTRIGIDVLDLKLI